MGLCVDQSWPVTDQRELFVSYQPNTESHFRLIKHCLLPCSALRRSRPPAVSPDHLSLLWYFQCKWSPSIKIDYQNQILIKQSRSVKLVPRFTPLACPVDKKQGTCLTKTNRVLSSARSDFHNSSLRRKLWWSYELICFLNHTKIRCVEIKPRKYRDEGKPILLTFTDYKFLYPLLFRDVLPSPPVLPVKQTGPSSL